MSEFTDRLPLRGGIARAPALGDAALRPMLRLLYYLYARRLVRGVRRQSRPRHIGIILDGNRRYGQRHGLIDPHAIYSLGARKLDEVLDWCGQLAIPAVTLWVLSTENFERPTEQVSGILAAIETKMRSLANDPQIHRQRVRVQAIGKLKLLPASTLAAICAAREATAGYNGMVLTIAVAYGGREEIADAVQALLYEEMRKGATLADAIEQITPAALSSGPVERFDCPASCYGRAYIANSISRMSIGRPSGR